MEDNCDNFNEEHFLPGNNRKTAFVLPRGYFNSLSARILNRIEHEQELKNYSVLTGDRKQNFKVPADYFSSLTNRLEHAYELSTFPQLAKRPKSVLKVPANYFNETERQLLDKFELESELKEFSVLSSIPKKNSFKVSQTYFETSTDTVEEKIHTPSLSIFMQITSTLFRPQMAIAASLILIVGISAIWYFNKQDAKELNGDCLTLACLEKNEILNEKNIQDFDEESLYEMVDEEALDQQLSEEEKTGDSLNTDKN